MIIIGVDTGGTFTDLIYRDGEGWRVFKLLSTPHNPAQAVLAGLENVAAGRTRHIVHGSTVATNAILERKGVRTALVTNRGFTDVIAIGRQNRSRLYDLHYRREPPIIEEELRFGVRGRILASGEEAEPLDEEAARSVVAAIGRRRAESVAVCFLFAFANPDHERRMAQWLKPLGIPISLSHEILSEFREFERTSTTVINAYVSPKMQGYISDLLDHIGTEDTLRIMQSNGGSISAQTAMKESVRTILSGPAGGVVGAYEIGKTAGFPRLITFDMGGTSTDVSLIDGKPSLTLESSISGYPVKTPMIDIHTVGAGGGSIAAVDSGGSLTVGPASAGADPGPICYGKGKQITVTDANLFLGRLIPDHFLGGTMRLHRRLLDPPFEQMAARVKLDTRELAEGILAVANTNMERAIRVISVERGYDPREFTLFSFGGAGGLHAAYLARLLNIPQVLIPNNPGILSAIGMLMADVIKDYSQTVMLDAAQADAETLGRRFDALEQRGRRDLVAEGIQAHAVAIESYLDMRYEGQSYEIITPFAANFIERFHQLHEKMYGYRNPDKPVQIVNIRLRARGTPEKPQFERWEPGEPGPVAEAFVARRQVVFDGRLLETPIIRRDALRAGNRIEGPAVIVEYSSTLLLPPFAAGRVDEYGNLILAIGHEA